MPLDYVAKTILVILERGQGGKDYFRPFFRLVIHEDDFGCFDEFVPTKYQKYHIYLTGSEEFRGKFGIAFPHEIIKARL